MITTIFLAVAAIVAAVWPAKPKAFDLPWPLPGPSPQAEPQPRGVTYEAAIRALSQCRTRLVATETLGEKERAAIDTLTLALVNGSEKP